MRSATSACNHAADEGNVAAILDPTPAHSKIVPISVIQMDCACSLTRRAARSVTQLYDLVLTPVKMKATQFVLLRAIAEAGQIAQWQLGRDLSIAVETLTRRLATMRRAGWVELRSSSDRRERLYCITDAGRAQLEKALPYFGRAQRRLQDQLGADGWRQMQQCLDRLAHAAERSISARSKNVAPQV
jgi:DNA-binding MarR family transcriptional regulator